MSSAQTLQRAPLPTAADAGARVPLEPVPASGNSKRVRADAGLSVDASSHTPEFLTLLNDSLTITPERADLWVMRFECLKSLGFKKEFAAALLEAFKTPALHRQLDWQMLQTMWEEVAPGQPMPVEVKLPSHLTTQAISATAIQAATSMARVRRFNDVAMKVAPAELAELSRQYTSVSIQAGFLSTFARKTAPFLRRPSPLEYSNALSNEAGPHVRLFLKREDGRGISAEAEHAAAQCYIASVLNKPAVVTANDVDAHAIATAQMAPLFKQRCTVVVRPQDLTEKADFVAKLQSLGATVVPAPEGMIGADPREGALRLWQSSQSQFHLALSMGTAPAPYPAMLNNFASLLGREVEAQFLTQGGGLEARKRSMVAAVGSEADSIGFVLPILNRKEIEVVYAEPEPGGVAAWRPSQRLKPYNGQIREHSWLRASRRIQHVPVSDAAATARRDQLARIGLTVSLEDSRAVALAMQVSKRSLEPRDFIVLVA